MRWEIVAAAALDSGMDIRAYLDRIGYRGPLTPTAGTLRALQAAHLQAVPFENLSIHADQPIVLDDESLFDKVVSRRRGGFCYELNGLFAALLRTLGFRVAKLSAGVARADGTFGPDFDHMALLVTLGERWLTDVGFGDSFRDPLRLDERREQPEGPRAFRIDEDGGRFVLLRRDGAESPGSRSTASPRDRTNMRTTPRCAATTRPRRSRPSPGKPCAPWPRRKGASP